MEGGKDKVDIFGSFLGGLGKTAGPVFVQRGVPPVADQALGSMVPPQASDAELESAVLKLGVELDGDFDLKSLMAKLPYPLSRVANTVVTLEQSGIIEKRAGESGPTYSFTDWGQEIASASM